MEFNVYSSGIKENTAVKILVIAHKDGKAYTFSCRSYHRAYALARDLRKNANARISMKTIMV